MGSRHYGVSFANLRKALHLIYFGAQDGACNDFTSAKYKYIIPMSGAFDNPLLANEDPTKDTFIMFWVERDSSLTQDDYYIDDNNTGWDRQRCIADVLVRFVGKEAEVWARALRHLTKRKGISAIWSGVCNAEKLEYTSPLIPRRVDYFGRDSQIAFDIRFRLYYDEYIATGWEPLEGVSFKFSGALTVEDGLKGQSLSDGSQAG